MILAALGAFVFGFIQVFMVSLQVRLLASKRKGASIFLTSVVISTAWVLGVHSVVGKPSSAPFYVLGCACGTLTAARIPIRDLPP